MKNRKRAGYHRGAVPIKNLDSIHIMCPYLLKNRTDSEVYISEQIDLSAIMTYLEKKNAEQPDFRYTFFHVIAAAIAKTMILRPHVNRYYSNKRLYQRKDVRLAFAAKKIFSDRGEETLVIYDYQNTTTFEDFHQDLKKQLTAIRSGKDNSTGDIISTLAKLPRPIFGFLMNTIYRLDQKGWLPAALIDHDPYHASVFLSNLGSIKLNAGYHHLTNFGTNSFFVVIGEKHRIFEPDDSGILQAKEVLDLGFTLDERIADGYYYSKTLKLLRYLLQNPELLEFPAEKDVNYEQ